MIYSSTVLQYITISSMPTSSGAGTVKTGDVWQIGKLETVKKLVTFKL